MSQNNHNNEGLSVDFGDELSKNLTIHKNVKQEIIITTEDKIKLVLINTREILTSQRDWWTPAGLLLSFIATLSTADFKDALTLPKEFWHAIFVLLTIASAVWLLISLRKLYKSWGRDDLTKIIEQIKLKVSSTDALRDENTNQVIITKGIIIHSAKYGANGHFEDLTAKISDFVAKNILEFKADNSLVDGKDPIVGTPKKLEISCTINGQKKGISALEGAIVKIE
jgi:hypothetical protein